MRRIRLTATEQVHLEHLFKTTPDRRRRDRCQAVLMATGPRSATAETGLCQARMIGPLVPCLPITKRLRGRGLGYLHGGSLNPRGSVSYRFP